MLPALQTPVAAAAVEHCSLLTRCWLHVVSGSC